MPSRIRAHQIEGVPGAVAVVCESPEGDDGPPTHAARVEPAALTEFLATIDPAIETLVFLPVDEAEQVDADAARIMHLVVALRNAPAHVAAIRRVPAVNAAKRVSDGVVVEAVDRETLNLLRPPEVVDRRVLETMLERPGATRGDQPVNPTMLAASDGGKVLVVEDDGANGQAHSGDNPMSAPDASLRST